MVVTSTLLEGTRGKDYEQVAIGLRGENQSSTNLS